MPKNQDSAYSSGLKYTKIVNMVKSWIWQGSRYASIILSVRLQDSEYSTIANMPGSWTCIVTQVLPILVNMTAFWIRIRIQLWNDSELSRILNARILNVSEAVHSIRSMYKLLDALDTLKTRYSCKIPLKLHFEWRI